MTIHEDQIRLIADEAERQLASEQGRQLARLRRSRVLLAGAASLVVLLAVGAAVVVASQRSEVSVVADVPNAGPRPIPENEPTVVADPSEVFLVATDLPAGFSFDVALDFESFGPGDEPFHAVRYRSGERIINITTNLVFVDVDLASETEPFEVDGIEWRIRRGDDGFVRLVLTSLDDRPADEAAVTADVEITGDGLTDDEVRTLMRGLEEVPATDLPRPPLTFLDEGGALVAEATQDGVPKQLRVRTDGRSFSMSVTNGGGGPSSLGRKWIVVSGASGPNPNLVVGGRSAESLIEGIVHPDVATVEVELTDGTVIVSQPQDLFWFEENFFLIAFPTDTEGGLERLAAVTARDAEGVELARDASFGQG